MSQTPTQHHAMSNLGRLERLNNNRTFSLDRFIKPNKSKKQKKHSTVTHQMDPSDSMDGFTVVESKRGKSSKKGKSTTDRISTGNTYSALSQQKGSSPKIPQPQVQSYTQPSASATFWGNLTK